MKILTTLILSLLLSCFSFAGSKPFLEVATYDHDKITNVIGDYPLDTLEYEDKYKNAIIHLYSELKKIEERLINADSSEEIDTLKKEILFIRDKLRANYSLAQASIYVPGYSEGHNYNKSPKFHALVQHHFSKRYSIINEVTSYNPRPRSFTHLNVKFIDITDELIVILKKSLAWNSVQ